MSEYTTSTENAERARADWQGRIGRRRTGDADDRPLTLDAPTALVARSGRGQVTLDWTPVPEAIGYQVYRSTGDAPPTPLDHHGGDVLAVPHPPYADTTGEPGRPYEYAVAALRDVDLPGVLSEPVRVAALPETVPGAGGDGPAAAGAEPLVRVMVEASGPTRPVHRPWRPMVGSEHLSHLLSAETTGGQPIGADLAEALRIMRTELGVGSVRAHAILCDDLGVYREVDGAPVYDFSGVDEVYDKLLSLGLRPVVELSFMPRDLASDPSKTVFAYGAVVSPPRDWQRWAELIRALVSHLIDRYGREEVRHWPFEVWNEANLEVFWSGTRAEFLRLYEVTVRAVRDVDPGLTVGGPASAAAGWVGELLDHVDASGAPIDFVSTHTYGVPPLDLRPLCARHGRPDLGILWTEWGATPTHFNPVGDEVFAATFLLRGMRSAANRLDALAHWVASDHFEELGRPPRLFHGGFGLLTVGNLRKPRFWALALADRLGEHELPATLTGDGAESLVEAWAARGDDGTVTVLVWNGTLDQSKAGGDRRLDRDVRVELHGLDAGSYRVRHWRIDREHSNIRRVWQDLDGGDWPTGEQWELLRARDILDEYRPEQVVPVADGGCTVDFPLPMPGVSFLRLEPAP
ncbi:GH39 family glycosyl hydrolase [Plantactinospora sp. KLBMP9567]|uniref:GH39 family glycosyl hydrolase n=1 Tax=Plantactinospora sp. KLBMP9567 TaxID=3085900 RepID=UPI0029820781|nr:xylan 1,4-beta-xylosidase [Plantactinospora sp. KLBMP9567]MDW5326638.1 xylan 1,4-beta-xylosidase [Plantactinospora sp. KLBMP9567]